MKSGFVREHPWRKRGSYVSVYGSVQNIYLSLFASFLFISARVPVFGLLLVRYSPVVEPLQVAVLRLVPPFPSILAWTEYKGQWLWHTGHRRWRIAQTCFISQHPIGKKSKGEDGKVKSRVVVVDVRDTSHGDERQVVEEPTNDG